MRHTQVRDKGLWWEWWAYEGDIPQQMGWRLTRKAAIRSGNAYFRKRERTDRERAEERARISASEKIPYNG